MGCNWAVEQNKILKIDRSLIDAIDQNTSRKSNYIPLSMHLHPIAKPNLDGRQKLKKRSEPIKTYEQVERKQENNLSLFGGSLWS
jgi:EAL domain-containing protein (putative c-di-GMP-specific phosphodiesterase class I)